MSNGLMFQVKNVFRMKYFIDWFFGEEVMNDKESCREDRIFVRYLHTSFRKLPKANFCDNPLLCPDLNYDWLLQCKYHSKNHLHDFDLIFKSYLYESWTIVVVVVKELSALVVKIGPFWKIKKNNTISRRGLTLK